MRLAHRAAANFPLSGGVARPVYPGRRFQDPSNIKRGGERARAAPGVSHCCGAFSVGTGGYTPPAIYPIESRFAFLTVSICRLRMQ